MSFMLGKALGRAVLRVFRVRTIQFQPFTMKIKEPCDIVRAVHVSDEVGGENGCQALAHCCLLASYSGSFS